MADGPTGEHGATAVRRAAVDYKHACAVAVILPQPVVVLTAKGMTPSPSLATRMGVQVRMYLILLT